MAFRRSIDINTNLSRTHAAYAFWTLYQQGKLTQALDELRLSLRLDPLSLDLRRMLAYVQVSTGQYSAAIDNCRYVLKEDPTFPLIRLVLARALLFTGKPLSSAGARLAMTGNIFATTPLLSNSSICLSPMSDLFQLARSGPRRGRSPVTASNPKVAIISPRRGSERGGST